MNPATNGVVIENSPGERCASVRTSIIEREELPADMKNAHHHVIDDEHAGLTLGNLATSADGIKAWHAARLVVSLRRDSL
jgi:hypothetical protein